jgi:putative transcriptional regulator
MKKRRTSKVVRYRRNRLPSDKTDWAQLDAMTDDEVVAAARSDPDAQPLTPAQLARMRRVPRVKIVRQRLGMTQAEFAEAFHLPITTLRDASVQKLVSTSAVVVQAKPSANSSRPKMIMVAPGRASVSRPATGKMKASMMPADAPRLVAAGTFAKATRRRRPVFLW